MESSNETIDNMDSIETEKMRVLRNECYKTVEDIVKDVSNEEFITAIGDSQPLKNKSRFVEKLRAKFNTLFVSKTVEQLDEFIAGENLDGKFSELSILEENNAAYEDEKAWRPPGDVDKHLRAPLISEKLKHMERSKQFVEEKEKSVEFLKTKVIRGRDQVQLQMNLLDELQDAVSTSAFECKSVFVALDNHEI